MECENNYCIYEKKGKCILDTISLDTTGQCIDCIYFNIDDDTLQKLKSKTLNDLEKRMEEMEKRTL